MGFFSFKTADTKESIPNVYSGRHTRTVYLLQPGNKPIAEPEYDGYGEFGSVDAYVWLAKMNADAMGVNLSGLSEDEIRSAGITMAFQRRLEIIYPLKFSFDENAVYGDLPASEDCEFQGYFY